MLETWNRIFEPTNPNIHLESILREEIDREMDALRKQLDVLMGANRNGDVREVNRKYYDRDVCRLFLSGLCPHELFQLTVLLSPRFKPLFVLFYALIHFKS